MLVSYKMIEMITVSGFGPCHHQILIHCLLLILFWHTHKEAAGSGPNDDWKWNSMKQYAILMCCRVNTDHNACRCSNMVSNWWWPTSRTPWIPWFFQNFAIWLSLSQRSPDPLAVFGEGTRKGGEYGGEATKLHSNTSFCYFQTWQ